MTVRCLALLLLTALPCLSQIAPETVNKCTLRIDVINAAGGHAPAKLQVKLSLPMSNFPIAVRVTDSTGVAEFQDLQPGQYHVVVTGEGIETVDSGSFFIHGADVFSSKTIAVRTTTANARSGGSPTVAAGDLVPDNVMREYSRGTQEMEQRHWKKAIEHFEKAIAVAPQFSAAYNNMAVCYGQMGNREQERQALQQAIGLNERCVPALINLARMAVDEKRPAEAPPLLERALAADPTNVEALSVLSEAFLQQGRYDAAIVQAHRAHGLPHAQYAVVHYTAARAYEHLDRLGDAITELRTFLQEEPEGGRANFVRKVLPAMEKEAAVSSARP